MKTNKEDILKILLQEGISGSSAEKIYEEIADGDRFLEGVAPAYASSSVLNRIERDITQRLAQDRLHNKRYVLFKRAVAVAAAIMLVFGVLHIYQGTGGGGSKTQSEALLGKEANILLEATDWADLVLTDQNGQASDDLLTDLVLIYEEPDRTNDSLQGKEQNHGNQKNIVYRDSWYWFV